MIDEAPDLDGSADHGAEAVRVPGEPIATELRGGLAAPPAVTPGEPERDREDHDGGAPAARVPASHQSVRRFMDGGLSTVLAARASGGGYGQQGDERETGNEPLFG